MLRQWDTSLSLGHYYGFAAEWAGLTVWDAGKLMGLAAYGRPNQPTPLHTVATCRATIEVPVSAM